MPTTIVKKTDYIKEVKRFFNPLDDKQQAIFFDEIKKIYKQKIELEMLGFDLPNDITLDEIITECRKSRKKSMQKK